MKGAMLKAPLLILFSLAVCAGCKEEKETRSAPPPPVPSVAKAGACAEGGGKLTDPVSATFFPTAIGGYCIDPQGEMRTYGEKGKLSVDDIATTAFDGEYEVYKRFGIKRLVSLHYIEGSGKGGSVEVYLSQFGDAAGAYAMYTLRVVAGDPADPSTPKVLAATAAGAIGTGRAYVWRGQYLAELQYVNEQESPAELAKSSETILSAIGTDMGERLPGPKTLPPAAQILPTGNLIPNGIVFHPKDVLAYKGVGPVAMGFYKNVSLRWRVLSIVKDDNEQAKDVFKTIKKNPGALPLAGVGDEGVRVHVSTLSAANEANEKSATAGPKIELVVARKGNVVWGVGNEEYALHTEKANLSTDALTTILKDLVATPLPTSPATASSSSKKK
jgi:hypothetical protein